MGGFIGRHIVTRNDPRTRDVRSSHDCFDLIQAFGLRPFAKEIIKRIDGGDPLAAHLGDDEAVTEWLSRYRERLRAEHSDDDARRERMHRTNPRYVLRNWLAQHAISAAESGDLAPLDRLLGCLRRPFDEQPECADLDAPPPDWAAGLSVSCSS